MTTSKVLCDHQSQISYITLNYPEKRNAFDNEMSQAVITYLREAEQKKQRAVVIKANMIHEIFSAGHNLEELTSVHEIINDPMFEMFDCICLSPLPIIAQVNGDVYAGALHLLIVCDLVYATQNVNIVMTANKMGVPFATQHYQNWLAVMGVHKVKELFFTASKISAQDAYNSGIFNAIFKNVSQLEKAIDNVCKKIISCCPEGITNTKLQLNTLVNTVSIGEKDQKRIDLSRKEILSSDIFKQRIDKLIDKLHSKNK